MSSIFENRENAIQMVRGAYKKLKAYLYYDKTLVFAKKRLAVLESDRESFIKTLETIAENISNENVSFFDDLINELTLGCFPKNSSHLNPKVI